MTSPSPISSTGSDAPVDPPAAPDPVKIEAADSDGAAESAGGDEPVGETEPAAVEPEAPEVAVPELALPGSLAGSAARNSDHAISARSTIALIVSGLLVLLLCVIGAAIGGFFSDVTDTGQDGDPATTASVRASVGATTFTDGKFVVGEDIKSGTYTTTVPEASTCSWERASSADGSAASVIDSGVQTTGKSVVVTIKATDEVFRSQGCGTWRPVKS